MPWVLRLLQRDFDISLTSLNEHLGPFTIPQGRTRRLAPVGEALFHGRLSRVEVDV